MILDSIIENPVWMPIEEASKESYGCFEQACVIGFVTWGKEDRVHKHVGPAIWQQYSGQWEFTETSFDVFPAPTHFMPFPSPPPLKAKQMGVGE